MVQYRTDCLFPGQGIDFASTDPKIPHITIVTRKTHILEEVDAGWLYIVVEADAIDKDLARRTIANAIGVSAEEIDLSEA